MPKTAVATRKSHAPTSFTFPGTTKESEGCGGEGAFSDEQKGKESFKEEPLKALS